MSTSPAASSLAALKSSLKVIDWTAAFADVHGRFAYTVILPNVVFPLRSKFSIVPSAAVLALKQGAVTEGTSQKICGQASCQGTDRFKIKRLSEAETLNSHKLAA